ncbi:MAG TPA: helix-turn-helix transcriptional regulator [Candidatus Limnocylindrales bacterium]|nr:helix-turn-helix transcriptional regulator [Candidatus Limnocylindrales bacterium]
MAPWTASYIRRADVEAILDFLARIDDLDAGEAYTAELLAALRALIPCDSVQYEAVDVEARRFLDDIHGEFDDLYWAVGPCPITDYRTRTGDLTAIRMSDVIGRARYHETPLYREYYLPSPLEHALDLGLSAERTNLRSILLQRERDVADFSDRDRAVLELLRPHLRAREARAELRRRAGELDGAAPAGDRPSGTGALLTAREREILNLVGLGRTNAQIAAELWIAPATVKKHLENVYLKLGVAGRAAAATSARTQSGLAV